MNTVISCRRRPACLFAGGLLAMVCGVANGAPPDATVEARLELSGMRIDPDNVSAIAGLDGLLVIGSDEGASIQVFTKTDTGRYQAVASGPIALESRGEVDIEGIAWGPSHVYVVGSHSLARKKIKPERTVADNRSRLSKAPEDEPKRHQIVRLKLDSDGALDGGSLERVTLDAVLTADPILERFRAIPGKENGIDIEALAFNGDELLVGFRGPSLTGPYIPVLALTFKSGQFKTDAIQAEMRFLDLNGRGIRGMAEVPGGGVLVLGGPVGDEPTPWELYYWNGRDALSGSDVPDAKDRARPLCRIGCPDTGPSCEGSSAKAEGVEFVAKSDREIRFMIVYDSATDGALTLFSCPFPAG